MSTIRKRDILAIVVIAAMLIAMVPTMVALFPAMVSANDNGTVSGNFTTGNVNPTITSVSITTIGDGTVTTGMSMTPYTSYKAKIVAGDANEINDIDRVEVVIYFDQTDGDSDSDPGDVGYTQTIACLTWVKGPGWSILPNSGNTTWALNSGDCSVPTNLTAPSGIWVCGFRVGKVAKEATSSENLR